MVDRLVVPTPREILARLAASQTDPVDKKSPDTLLERVRLGQFAKEFMGHIVQAYGEYFPDGRAAHLLSRPFTVEVATDEMFKQIVDKYRGRVLDEDPGVRGVIFPSSMIVVRDWQSFANYLPIDLDIVETEEARRVRGFAGITDTMTNLLMKYAAVPNGEIEDNHRRFHEIGAAFYQRQLQRQLGLPYITDSSLDRDLLAFGQEEEQDRENVRSRYFNRLFVR